jgi:hypothetical protein
MRDFKTVQEQGVEETREDNKAKALTLKYKTE